MRLSFGAKSMLLFALSCVFLILLTLFESLLSGLSTTTERIVSGLLLAVPGLAGLMLGVIGLKRKESPGWLAILGILLNGLFALFQVCVLSFAG